MAQDIRWQQRFNNFNRSLKQLTAAVDLHVQREFTELEKQGVIQGFEIVHELAWNVLKDLLEFEGIQGIVGSRGAVREAFKRGILEDGELWLDMIDKRNLTSHTYNADLAQEMANTIVQRYYPSFVALQQQLQQRI